MAGLVLKLRPHEKMLVNGAVVQNGPKPVRLRICTTGAAILRLRDAIHPDDAKTPARRLYYVAQLALTREADPRLAAAEIAEGLKSLRFLLPGQAAAIASIEAAAREDRFYVAMRKLRQMFPAEDALIEDARAP